jgi:hypothetical protein
MGSYRDLRAVIAAGESRSQAWELGAAGRMRGTVAISEEGGGGGTGTTRIDRGGGGRGVRLGLAVGGGGGGRIEP